jgi:formate--tetrahydrofolate ligase
MKQDWELAQAAEREAHNIKFAAEAVGIQESDILLSSRLVAKIDAERILRRHGDSLRGKYVDVTAITPTPLGEGKSTTTIGLVDGLAAIGQKVIGTIRQPSSGPIYNVKGSAAGGGYAQVVPLTDFSLGLLGDIDAVTNANNLAMVAITSRFQHEAKSSDTFLESKNIKRLNIARDSIQMKWAMDFCAQALREFPIDLLGEEVEDQIRTGFQISVASEVMAILTLADSVDDLILRLGRIVVAHTVDGKDITTKDIEVDGAMAAILLKAFNPNLMQTMEGNPVLVHCGPFANISIGQSSVIADKVALSLADFVVTESGFAAEIGFEKFLHIKSKKVGRDPDCAVIVATVRALKYHGGAPLIKAGDPIPDEYTTNHPELVTKGIENLLWHSEIVRRSGVPAVICINKFETDTDEEIAVIQAAFKTIPVVISTHWADGGVGAVDLARAVVRAACSSGQPIMRMNSKATLSEKLDYLARLYGAKDHVLSLEAQKRLQVFIKNDADVLNYDVCMAKTALSITHDPTVRNIPDPRLISWVKDGIIHENLQLFEYSLPIVDFMVYKGARLLVPVAGDIKLMPGTVTSPGFRRIKVNSKTHKVEGLF